MFISAIPKVLLLLTDGYSNGVNPHNPANGLRNSNVNIFTIGVGSSVSDLELKGIASDPDEDHVFKLRSFNQLQLAGFSNRLSAAICGGKFRKDSHQKNEIFSFQFLFLQVLHKHWQPRDRAN